MDDKYNPHDTSDTDKASRENVNLDPEDLNVDSANVDVNAGSATDSPMERGSGQLSQPDKPLPSKDEGAGAAGGSAQRSAGITNRPVEEEQQNQEALPPRGKANEK